MADRYFAAHDLNHTEARLLTLLNAQGGESTQEALSQKIYVDRTNVGRALKQLETKGCLTRSKDKVDKRANLVKLTKKGQKAIADIDKTRKKMANEFFGDLTEEQAQSIVETLQSTMKLGAGSEA